MAIDQLDVVDYIGVDRSGDVGLVICDHLPWSEADMNDTFPPDEYRDPKAHMLLLQEKINRYLGFIESGEIYEKFPKAIGRKVRLLVAARYPLSDGAEGFDEYAKEFLAGHGYEIDIDYRAELSDRFNREIAGELG